MGERWEKRAERAARADRAERAERAAGREKGKERLKDARVKRLLLLYVLLPVSVASIVVGGVIVWCVFCVL